MILVTFVVNSFYWVYIPHQNIELELIFTHLVSGSWYLLRLHQSEFFSFQKSPTVLDKNGWIRISVNTA